MCGPPNNRPRTAQSNTILMKMMCGSEQWTPSGSHYDSGVTLRVSGNRGPQHTFQLAVAGREQHRGMDFGRVPQTVGGRYGEQITLNDRRGFSGTYSFFVPAV